ncbi:MAG: hypothetical protein COT73_05035 [Bdellovibrio sp. CG10_big_fil_rev_8_21_14_0_10_47_8]|nr:MAG: hypothetical protein COT73_05035 [Bdellovibrio sp. CG10_big_fil_rev_8_21_14_0_10_47_8]
MTETLESTAQKYFVLIEKILHHFAGDQFKDEVRMAKSEFFDNAGILDENSDHFELRMSQFFDWYFFTRELKGYAQTPLDAVFMARELRFSNEEVDLVEKLRQHRHSLFQFIKMKGDDMSIKDLISGKKMVVKRSPWTFGFDPEEIFEARLIPDGENWIFTRGFCFHPMDAKKYIFAEIKRHKKDPDLNPEDMMLKLIKMRYKFERYRHVKINMIYSNENTWGG